MNGGAILITLHNKKQVTPLQHRKRDRYSLCVGPGVAVIWYPQIFRTRGYQSTEDLIPGGVPNPCSRKERRCFAGVLL